jgi:threonine synthase
MTTLTGLRCHVCGTPFPAEAVFVCDQCFGPLEPVYDYDLARRTFTRERIAARPPNLWRYRELLPVAGEPLTGFHSGWTPLIKADRLAGRLGVRELYVKDDGVNHPTMSYKDRVVSVAATRAVELGFQVFGCASTGNLANSVAAHAARLGLECYVFIPDDLEAGKVVGSAVYHPHVLAVRGNYDDINRLCTQIADRYQWGFANINLRSYYAEGAKTFAFEIAEQLGWRFPAHVVSPVAGGTLLPRLARGFRELQQLGLVEGELPRLYAAQAAGCAPVVRALEDGLEYPEPVRPETLAKSIAIGNPADGFQAIEVIRATGGWGAMVSDEEILDGVRLLAETEGVFTEPAGGTTLAAARVLVESGRIPRDEPIVVCITGNGYKTAEVMLGRTGVAPVPMGRSLAAFEEFLCAKRDRDEFRGRNGTGTSFART